MSKLTEKLKAARIHNSWEFAGKGNVYIAYSPNDYGRGGRCARWSVIRPGFRTDPDGHWQDSGHKTFMVFGGGVTNKERKESAFNEAKQWASDRYGIKEWAKTPFGDWMDAAFVKKRTAELLTEAEKAIALKT